MKRKIRSIIAAILAAAMCASFTGCGKSDLEKELENAADQLDKEFGNTGNNGGGNNSNNPSASTSDVTSNPEVKFEMTDEIKNAAFNSGLIQINNDVFQRGGYITVADFVEKYKDRYDIIYQNANLPYEEAGEYLLQSADYVGSDRYHLLLTAKDGVGDSSKKISVQIENRTTSGGDDKIPLADGIVTEFNIDKDPTASNPCWYPQGFTDNGSGNKGLETTNEVYKKDSFIKMLEDKGFTLFEGNEYATKTEDLNNRYWIGYERINFQVTGEVNSFGKKPVYKFIAWINADTDKLHYVTRGVYGYVE